MDITLPQQNAVHPPPVFVTLPTTAKATKTNPEKLARDLSTRGISPDGVLQYGHRLIPIFRPERIEAIRDALNPVPAVTC